jgi:30S ribosomal protein S31
MGKGDKKTRRGKIFRGTYGVRRRKKKSERPFLKPRMKEATAEKDKKPPRGKKEVAEIIEVPVADETVKPVDIKTNEGKKEEPGSTPPKEKEEAAETKEVTVTDDTVKPVDIKTDEEKKEEPASAPLKEKKATRETKANKENKAAKEAKKNNYLQKGYSFTVWR